MPTGNKSPGMCDLTTTGTWPELSVARGSVHVVTRPPSNMVGNTLYSMESGQSMISGAVVSGADPE